MGQGVSTGAVLGFFSQLSMFPFTNDFFAHAAMWGGCAAAGLSVDFASDVLARKGKCVIERTVLLNAADMLKHVTSFHARNDNYRFTRLIAQRHQWVVLQSHQPGRYYTVQKEPKTGNVTISQARSLREANDFGLRAANRPLMSGETQMYRGDCTFDVPDDLQVAYVIAWLKKEDPRWAFSTENSSHFCVRLRFALNDF